jgi:hypothetical protein
MSSLPSQHDDALLPLGLLRPLSASACTPAGQVPQHILVPRHPMAFQGGQSSLMAVPSFTSPAASSAPSIQMQEQLAAVSNFCEYM